MRISNLKFAVFLFLIFSNSYFSIAQTIQASNIILKGIWSDSSVIAEPFYGIKYNGIWGWEDGNGREYAIIGATNGTYIVEVTNAAFPVLRDFVPGLQTNCIWREYKTYSHYLYMVSDDQTPNGLQIADLSFLPDSVHLVQNSDSIIQRCHTIFIDGNKLYGGALSGGVVGNYSGMAVFSLINPEVPQLLRKMEQDITAFNYAHDMFVRNDTIYASAANDGLFILKFLTNNTFSLLASLTSYPDQGYNHSSALSDNGKTLIFCDEVPGGLSVKSLNVTDFSNLQINTTFQSHPGATAHNPFPFGNDYVVIAYYKDGLHIYNISDPSNITESGYLDTYWQNDSCLCYNNTNTDYAGCWGAYPYFSNGKIIASDMQNGLFIVDATSSLNSGSGLPSFQTNDNSINVYPNPVKDILRVDTDFPHSETYQADIYEISGRKIFTKKIVIGSGKSTISLDLSTIENGLYTIKMYSETQVRNFKISKYK